MLKTIIQKLNPMPDAVSMLKADHRVVDALFIAYAAAKDKRMQASVVRKICTELAAHSHIEKTIFYPEVKKSVKGLRDEVNEGFVEHAAVDRLVKELSTMKASDEFFAPKVKVLKEFVHHHVKEEEADLFPKVVESKVDLTKLGEKMAAGKQRFLARAA